MNFKPIFNKLTVDSYRKFIEPHDYKVKKGSTKEAFQDGLLSLFEKNDDAKLNFQKFYQETEEAGRKHFHLFAMKFNSKLIDLIKSNCKEFTKEEDRTFDPTNENGKIFYSFDSNSLTVKRLQIKKRYDFIEDIDDGKMLSRQYDITNIHFVEFWTFDFKNSRIICGYDTYGDLLEKKNQEKELLEFLGKLLHKDYHSFESYINSDHIEQLRFLPNCIVYSLSNQANRLDSATFKKERADIVEILKDLKKGSYKISEIKENNPEFDIQTNLLFEAGQSAAIDSDVLLQNNKSDFYYFTESSGILTTFRIRIDAIRSQVITFSESTTKQELWDVFNRIN